MLTKGARDAVDGDTAVHTFSVERDQPGSGELYFDCVGPTNATVTVGSDSQTSPCLSAGAYFFSVDASSPIVVTATGDTSWRVVLYTP